MYYFMSLCNRPITFLRTSCVHLLQMFCGCFMGEPYQICQNRDASCIFYGSMDYFMQFWANLKKNLFLNH